MKKRKVTSYIFIHYSDSRDLPASIIKSWHLARGFADIGYHFVIRKNGNIELGRQENLMGAHTRGWNSKSIGICLTGSLGEPWYPSPHQMLSLTELIKRMMKKYSIPESGIFFHKDKNATTCPSDKLDKDMILMMIKDNSIVETEDEMAFKEAFALMDNHRKVNFRIDITNGWGVSTELSRGGKENAWYESKSQTKHFPGGKLEQVPPDTDNQVRVSTIDGRQLAVSPKGFGEVKNIVDGSIFIKQSGLLNRKTYLYLSYIFEL